MLLSPHMARYESDILPCERLTLRNAAAPSSRQILLKASATPAYVRLLPCVMSRVFTTSRGVVAMPVMAPAAAPTF